jgi:acetyl-CoA C-acetyltransferase
MAIDPNTPILIGVGQCVDHWDGTDAAAAPSPHRLRERAALAALEDCGAQGAIVADIDCVVAVRTMLDSVPGAPQPFGRCANPPGSLAKALGIDGARVVYSVVGGDQPQTLVNEAAEAIFSGQAKTILIAGSEATAAMKLALKRQVTLDWHDDAGGDMEDRGLGARLLSPYEMTNGLGAPTQTYPAFEHALRARLGNSRDAHMALMSELWAGFADVAAANPYAQYPHARSAEFLSTNSADNYPIADPYLKWHVAQDAVNQGAAIIMTSVARAEAMGIDPAKWVYLHGYAQAMDRLPTERADLSRSQAIELTLGLAMQSAGKAVDDIALFDLYSCFPCAVLLAAEAIGLEWRNTPATVTGGLPFFGGAGNNYSLHAIATMAERLRAAPDVFGLVLANGGFLSKEAAGVYSAAPIHDWQPVSSKAIQLQIDETHAPQLLSESGLANIETYTVTFAKGMPQRAYVITVNDKGRHLARIRSGDVATLAALCSADPLGKPVLITHDEGTNYFAIAG